MRFVTLLLLTTVCAPLLAEYPRPELLLEAETLVERLQQQPKVNPLRAGESTDALSLIDVRPAPAYRQGGIQGATHVDVGQWKAAFGDGQDTEGWTQRIGIALANGPHSTVVVYDKAVTPNAARAWWLLKYWGVKDVRILNGGYQAFLASGGKPALPRLRKSVPANWQAKPHPQRLATAQQVMACIAQGDNQACLVDTRTGREVRSGYIPTACHTNWEEYVDPATGKVRSSAELDKLLARARFDRQQSTITYCLSGGRASVVAFAAELMGGEQVANYFGSWGEWSRLPGAPVATPAEGGAQE